MEVYVDNNIYTGDMVQLYKLYIKLQIRGIHKWIDNKSLAEKPLLHEGHLLSRAANLS